jgi:Tfp pilus assembly protein PilX
MWKCIERRIQQAVGRQLQQEHWLKHVVREQLQAEQASLKERERDLHNAIEIGEERARALIAKIAECEPVLLSYENACERALEQTLISNDAQAARYSELKKRLDAYEKVFQQLGVLIQKQPAGDGAS